MKNSIEYLSEEKRLIKTGCEGNDIYYKVMRKIDEAIENER